MIHRKYGYSFYFKCIQVTIEKKMNEILKAYDLTMSQEKILRYIRMNPDRKVSQKEIEEFYHISNPTVTGLINRLEQKGFIQRSTCSKDKRIHYISQTEKAQELSKTIHDYFKTLEAKMLEGFDEEEKEQLFTLLVKVIHNLEKTKEDTNDSNDSSAD